MSAKLVALSAALLLAGGTTAPACQSNSTAVLDDNFKNPDPGWGLGAASVTLTPQGLVIKPPVNDLTTLANPRYTLDGMDYCVDVLVPSSLPAPADEENSGDVGVQFWARDANNYYTVTISPDGTAGVDRLLQGNWQTVSGPMSSPAIKTAAGAVNEIEITVTGNAASLFVNGARIADFHGQAPPKGGPPGLYAESGLTTVTTWVFPRVQLRSLSK